MKYSLLRCFLASWKGRPYLLKFENCYVHIFWNLGYLLLVLNNLMALRAI